MVAGSGLLTAAGLVWYSGVLIPQTLHWPDRRPIAMLHVSSSGHLTPGNPRGWLQDKSIEVRTPGGRADFRRRLLAYADRSVVVMRGMGAQGMITWDIEGWSPGAYVGDPRLAETLAPELEGVADEYFRKFREAGFRVGVTLRPQDYAGGRQRNVWDAAGLLDAKIRYAKRRWGATLFYIDSNRIGPFPMAPVAFADLARLHPDILLIPEHETPGYFAFSAPYCAHRLGSWSLAAQARRMWPGAFSVINLPSSAMKHRLSELETAAGEGDVLMFAGWYAAPENTLVREIMKRLGGK